MTAARTRVRDAGPVTFDERRTTPTTEMSRSPGLRLQLTRPRADLTVLTAAGDIDSSTAPELAGLLWPALLVEHSSIVLDFTAVTFLGVAGLELLSAANTYAPHRGLRLVLIGGQPAVERAVRAGSPDVALHRAPHLASCTTITTAVREPARMLTA